MLPIEYFHYFRHWYFNHKHIGYNEQKNKSVSPFSFVFLKY